MARKPKADPTNVYPFLIFVTVAFMGVAAWFNKWAYVIISLGAAMFFLSLQLGCIFRQYEGIVRLIQILNGLFMASLRAQGIELEGTPPSLEEEVETKGI